MSIIFISMAVFMITLWRREYGVAAVILLWPAYILRTTIFGIPTTALELSIYAVVIGWLFMSRSPRYFTWPKLPHWFHPLIILWIIAWVVATVFSQDQQASLGALKAWLIDPLLFGLVMFVVIQAAKQRLVVYKAVALSGTIVALAGLGQLIWWRNTLQDGRLSSFFHPVANYAAMFLGPILVLTVGWLLWKQLSRGWWIAVGLMTAAMILTVSFGGYLATGVGLFVYWWRWPNRRTKGFVMMIAVVVVVLGIFGLTKTPYLAEKINTSDRSSSLVRTQIWRTSWQMIIEHPVLGIGPNAFEPVYRATIPKLYFPPLEWLVSQPHQLYLALWLETGLLGLVTFLVFIVWWMKSLWTRIKKADGLAISAVAAMLAILVHGFVDTPYFKNDLALIYVFIFLLPLLAIAKEYKK